MIDEMVLLGFSGKVVMIKTKSDDVLVGELENVKGGMIELSKPLKMVAIPQPNGQMAMALVNLDLTPAEPGNISVDVVFVAIDSVEQFFEVKDSNPLHSHYKSAVSGLALPKPEASEEVVKKLIKNFKSGGSDA